MQKNYSVQEFTDKYKNTPKQMRVSFLESELNIEDYIEYRRKLVLADKIVKSSAYATEAVRDDNGQIVKNNDGTDKYQQTNRIKVDSNMRYVLFVYTIIQTYTNINMDNKKMLEEFDMLNREGLVEKILAMIPKNEMTEFNTVVQQTFSDLMTNSYETHAFISNQIQRITDVLGVVLKPLVNKLADMSDEDIEKFGNKVAKFVDKKVK